MSDLSFYEKLKIFVDVSSSSKISIATIGILIFLAFILLTVNKKNAKITKLLFLGIYIILMLVMFLQYNDSLKEMFEYMMNNFFIVFYFPNVAIYLAAIIATNIILWVTIFNFKEDKLLKVLNTIIYCIIHYLLILILSIISKKKLDIFSQAAIYGNKNIAALISLTSIIFITWIIFLIIYKIIRSTQKDKDAAVVTKYVEVPVKKINPNIIEIKVPNIVKGNTKKKLDIVPIVVPNVVKGSLSKKAPEIIPVKEVDSINDRQDLIQQYESMFTLEDYKKVLDILKNENNFNTHHNDNTVTIEEFDEEPVEEVVESTISYDSNNNRTKLDELLNI